MAFDHIAVVGAGAWGTALANAIARAGRPVLLATRDRAGADVLVKARESPRLPGVRLDERVGIAPLGAEVGRYDVILLAVPSQHLRAAASAIAPALREGTPGIPCAKGIERGTHRFMTEVIAESARAGRAPRSCRGRALPPTWRAASLPRSRSPPATRPWPRRWRARSAPPRCGPIIPPTCAASRSAAPPRTCSPSPPASSRAAGSAPAPTPRW